MLNQLWTYAMWSLSSPPPITLILYRCLVPCKIPNYTWLVLPLALYLDENMYNVVHPNHNCGPFTSWTDTELVWIATEREGQARVGLHDVQYQRVNFNIGSSFWLRVKIWITKVYTKVQVQVWENESGTNVASISHQLKKPLYTIWKIKLQAKARSIKDVLHLDFLHIWPWLYPTITCNNVYFSMN